MGEAIAANLELDRWLAEQLADDPLANLAGPSDPVDVRWDAGWARRAAAIRKVAANPNDDFIPLRDADPLVEIPTAVYVEAITGEPVPRGGSMRCPLPDHDDRSPSFRAMRNGWRCYGCQRSGSIYDFAAILWGVEPRGPGFRQLQAELRSTFGLEGAQAA